MSLIRQVIYAVLLGLAVALLLWGLAKERKALNVQLSSAQERADNAAHLLAQQVADNQLLARQLALERTAQQKLANQTQHIRQALADRQTQIEELTRENAQLHSWSVLPLPDAARSLYQRPALTSAAAYREWLSRANTLPPASHQPP